MPHNRKNKPMLAIVDEAVSVAMAISALGVIVCVAWFIARHWK